MEKVSLDVAGSLSTKRTVYFSKGKRSLHGVKCFPVKHTGIRINSFTIYRQWLMECSSHHPPARLQRRRARRNLSSLTEGGVCVFVLDQEYSVCSSCTGEPWLLVLQLWHPQLRGTSPRQSPGLRECQHSSHSSAVPQPVPQHHQSTQKGSKVAKE